MLPGIAKRGYLYSVADWDVYAGKIAIASLALVAFAVLNIRGTGLSSRNQCVVCVLLVIGGALVSVVGVLLSPATALCAFENGI